MIKITIKVNRETGSVEFYVREDQGLGMHRADVEDLIELMEEIETLGDEMYEAKREDEGRREAEFRCSHCKGCGCHG